MIQLALRRSVTAAAVLTIIGGTARTARAQQGMGTPLVLNLPGSARAMALGGAYPLADGGSGAVFYNPGALGPARSMQLGVQWYGSSSQIATVSAGTEWQDGRIGIGVRAMSYDTGPPLAPDVRRVADLFTAGTIGVSELAAVLGYGREVEDTRFGIAAKVFDRRAGTSDYSPGGAIDLGALREVGPVTLGLAVRNLGPGLETGDGRVDLPRRVVFGASVPREPVGPLDIGGAAVLSRHRGGRYEAGAGLEVAWWPVIGRTFIGRMGIRTSDGPASPFSFGAAFLGDAIAVEYAYRGFDGRGGTHRIVIGWR